MPILIDATVLSNLASVGRLDLVSVVRDLHYLTSAVYEEIQQSVEEGYDFLSEVDKAIDDDDIKFFGHPTFLSRRASHCFRVGYDYIIAD